MIAVVDTHALIWFVQESPRLGRNARRVMADPEVALLVPTMVLVEIKHLEQSRRVDITLAAAVRAIRADARFTLAPLTLDVVQAAPTSLDIHDSVIVGTALALQAGGEPVGLVTRDEAVARAGLVRTLW